MTRSAYRCKACGHWLTGVKHPSKITKPLLGTRVLVVDRVTGTTTLLCPACGARLVHRGGRIDLGGERRTA